MKKCFKCGILKPLDDFYRHTQMSDGHVNKCKACNKKDVQDNYHSKADEKRSYDRKRNRYSISRIFLHKYQNILKRIRDSHRSNGVRNNMYGTTILSKEEWLQWCYQQENYQVFIRLYNEWVQSNFNRKLNPSIDRINSKKSYVLGNLQWLTLSENSQKYTK